MRYLESIVPGYSSHDKGSLGSVLVGVFGAKMIQKHVKLGSTDWLHFDEVALNLLDESFLEFVSDIRRAEIALGSDRKRITRSEHHKY
jgi:sialic acid synthase SpsE